MDWQDPKNGACLYLDRAKYLLREGGASWIAREIPIHLRTDFIYAATEDVFWHEFLADLVADLDKTEGLKRSALDYIRLFGSLAANAVELRAAQEVGMAKVVIMTMNDEHICLNCQQLASRTYSLFEVPILPSPDCTNEACRCFYTFSLDPL